MLMDEPFASVDAQTRGDLEDLVLRVRDEQGMTILLVTHDIDESVYLADRVLVLSTAPTTVVETLKVGLPRERDQITTRESAEFVHLRGEVARLLRHETWPGGPVADGHIRLRGYVGTLEVSRTPPRRAPVTDGPLIVQSDKTLLLEVDHPLADETRTAIAPFAELERAPEHVHTYRVTPLALWNARAAGHDAEQVVDALVRYSRYPVPQPLLVDVVDTMARFGRLQLVNNPAHGLVMVTIDRAVLEEILRNKKIQPMLGDRIDQDTVIVHPSERGRLKQALLKVGWPAEDLAGYVDGEHHRSSWTAGRLAAARLPAAGRRGVLGRRLRRGGAALRRRQDPGRRGGDGQGQGDHADPGHQHRRRPAVEARADRADLADRGGDRRVLRRAQGDPPGHHRHLPGDHPQDQGRVPAPGAVRLAATGAWSSTTRCTCCPPRSSG